MTGVRLRPGTGFTPEQSALSESLGRLLDKQGIAPLYPAEAAQSLEREFAAFGGPAALVPEEFGGSSLSTTEAALIAHAIGRAAAPVPCIGAMVATYALARSGTPEQKRLWLPAIALGELHVAVALGAPGLRTRDNRLDGHAPFVADTANPGLLLAEADGRLILVPVQAPCIEWSPLVTVDLSRRFAQARFHAAPAQPLGDASLARMAMALTRLLNAADAVGGAESLLQRSVEYARHREQFGRPIGAFQAIKHLCADMAAELELARALLWQAAAHHAADLTDAPLLCAQAKVLADEMARTVGRGAIEIHGAMGFASQSGLYAWTQRAAVSRIMTGPPEALRREIAAMQSWVV